MNKTLLIAPNAFKGTLQADEAAELIAGVFSEYYPSMRILQCPIADGGDGTCDLLSRQLGLEIKSCRALDALGRPVMGHYGFDPASFRAYLDVSTVSGLGSLREEEKQALVTSTFGTGKLIFDAIGQGAKTIVLGLGGSATVDFGVGILQALGLLFLDQNGRELIPFNPEILEKTKHVQLSKPLSKIKFELLCDVENTFFGEKGAIPVFGPQKGLKPDDAIRHEKAVSNLIDLFQRKTKKMIPDRKGYGAAGGIAYGLSFFFEVDLHLGAPYFFERVNLAEMVSEADYIVTGEGRYDEQSSGGKGAFELKKLIKEEKKRSILITSGSEGKYAGFDYCVQLPDLDFKAENFQQIARKNLIQSVRKFVQETGL
ncbi:glycerate kinase [Algoriphagus namhaensis]